MIGSLARARAPTGAPGRTDKAGPSLAHCVRSLGMTAARRFREKKRKDEARFQSRWAGAIEAPLWPIPARALGLRLTDSPFDFYTGNWGIHLGLNARLNAGGGPQ